MQAVIQESLHWIEINLAKPLTIRTLSDRVGYSIWHYQKIFKETVGMTPFIYIRHRRMLVARKLILESQCSLTNISLCLGYSQQSTFYMAFKKYFGITPKQLRQNKDSESYTILRES
ncbi:helix-turn-helix transcriptional regulator (plasmid) [Klebsiella oxytoca]|uniref:helix-turn-helix transcriptional regulator n=1 Tax=Klebsiella oxytoca TaxID=571 RepID=UPI0039828492